MLKKTEVNITGGYNRLSTTEATRGVAREHPKIKKIKQNFLTGRLKFLTS